jgi:GDP-L-fucose synthase
MKKHILLLGNGGFFAEHIKNVIKNTTQHRLSCMTRRRCNLLNKTEVDSLLSSELPDIIVNAAAFSGGIIWNQNNCDKIFHDNTLMTLNLLSSASQIQSVEKVISTISSCAYPDINEDIREESIFKGPPNKSIFYFGMQKRNAIIYSMALNKQFPNIKFLCPIINNMYGPYDSFDMDKTKVVMATIKRVVDAKQNNLSEITFLGTGKPTRQFTYVEDAALSILKLIESNTDELLINITTDEETSIAQLVYKVCEIVGYNGKIVWDTTKTDGQMRKSMNSDKAKRVLGFEAKTSLEDGLKKTIDWYLTKAKVN